MGRRPSPNTEGQMLSGWSKMIAVGIKWALGLLLLTGLGYLAVRYVSHLIPPGGYFSYWIRKPKAFSTADFQRPLDRDFLAKFLEWDETQTASWIDGRILLPFYDDVMKRQLSVEAVELGHTQRKDILRIVRECADILDMPVPRIYIRPEAQINASAGGFVDPVLVLDSRFLNRTWSDRQLRAVIGHELGHIKCRHTKLQLLVDIAIDHLADGIAQLALLGQLKWSREAEMSADNAGLICSQDLGAYERLLICLLLNLDAKDAKDIDVDSFLAQRSATKVSMYAEGSNLLSEFKKTHPFVADRIIQLREYAASAQYRAIWRR